ncbi:ABC.CD.P, putative ABC transport system permease protein [Nostoc flagelliforme CCNUN1]|uniref:ABC.CD.P, putative ABC transport system permease protein n=1 Tax=Nostoc flagelliforme CCNUN1 TaxID=2038116 RepID=A0A2K8SJ08_9NOSO|nr:ABC transporter permease DevC [Nostoc flagelliforme]AUB35407.1 ABC.CD.P, putative ABC transport system permease protein [Nostoc flagelliforme CCNUN1]
MFGKLFKKVPLAWRQLMKQKTRLLVAVAGIGFADMLMFVQLGFQNALYDSATQSHSLLKADLVLVNSRFQSLSTVQSFSREHLYQALAYEGVESVSSIYFDRAQWKNPDTGLSRDIVIWGVEPGFASFNLPEVRQKVDQLKLLNTVLFDRASREVYGAVSEELQKHGTFQVEVNNQVIQVVGLFTMGASFVADGNIITSDSTFLKLFPQRQSNQITVGLIHLKPGANLHLVQQQLATRLSENVKVFTPESFAAAEKQDIESQGTIGFIFGLGTIVGFMVGTVIVYQILYTDVVNHLPEYATLKAMGYSDRYLLGVLFQESLLLAVFGYIPGFLIAIALYQITYLATLLPLAMTLSRAVFVLIITIVMCSMSGAIAMQKLQSADPADIF